MFSDMTNNFLTAVKTQKGSAYTENGAISYLSTGSELIDQFGKVASYRGRPISIVAETSASSRRADRVGGHSHEAAVRQSSPRRSSVPQGGQSSVRLRWRGASWLRFQSA